MRRLSLCVALLLTAATTLALAQLAPPRRPFLFKDDRGDLAAARARGEHDITVVIAAMPGTTAQVARVIAGMGGTIRFRDNNVDYIRARVPLDSVERLARDPLVHSLDVNVSSAHRGFNFTMAGPLAPIDAAPFASARALVGARPGWAADTGKVRWPPVQSDYPLTHRYDPLGDMGAAELRKVHPTWDGRGVTLALIDLNPDPLEPELQVARTVDGKPVKKIQFYTSAVDVADEDDGRWLRMDQQVTASDGTFTYDGTTYKAPHNGTFRIAMLNEATYDSLSNAGLEKDLNRDGNPPGSSRLFGVIWDEKTNDVWVDTNQNLSFLDETALTDYGVRPVFGVFGTDNPKTPVRESVAFAVQIDTAKKMVAIDAGVQFHASLVVGASLGSRGTRGRYDGVAPGARLASYAQGIQPYGQTEAVILALENPQVDGAWTEQYGNITYPYLLRDGRLVPTVIYSRLIEKYKKPLMIPTHNNPVLGNSDELTLADCAIGVGGHESKANFLINYGVRTKYDDNLLITGGYGPMGNGATGPTIISPSNIMSGYRGWEDPATAYMASVYRTPVGYLIAGGTSTATPTAAGAVALLMSAAKQTGLPYDACSLKQAIAMSARYVPNIPAYKQGNGVINVAGAWELLKAMDKSGGPRVTITSSAPVKHVYSELLATPHQGVGLYERDGWSAGDHGERTVTFTRTSGPTTPMTFGLSFTGDSGTFSSPPSVTLPLNEAVPVTIGIAPKKPGVHSALLTLDNPSVPGHAYRMLTTIVAAEPLDASNHYTVVTKTEVPRPEMRSFFYRVPAGASALEVVLDAPKRAVQLAMVQPDTRYASTTHIVAPSGGRGGGGGDGANAPPPKETFVVADPVPGVWEVRLTDIEDTRVFDWRASEKGGPVPPTPVTFTISALATHMSVAAASDNNALQGGSTQTGTSHAVRPAQDVSLSNGMASFTGSGASYPLGSAHRARPTIGARAQQLYELDVPAGSAALMVKVSHLSDPNADLDVYVFDCTTKECRISSSGMTPLGEETVNVPHPAAGRWKVVVDAPSVPAGTVSYDYTDVVFNPAFGMVSVADMPGVHEGASPWSVKTNIWAAALPAGREPFAAFLIQGEATRTQPFTIGMVEVPADHR